MGESIRAEKLDENQSLYYSAGEKSVTVTNALKKGYSRLYSSNLWDHTDIQRFYKPFYYLLLTPTFL